MKKYVVLAALISAVPLCGDQKSMSPMPAPIVTNPNIIGSLKHLSDASGFGFLLQFLALLLSRLNSTTPTEYQAKITSALLMIAEREHIRQDEYENVAIEVMTSETQQRGYAIASQYLSHEGAIRISNSHAGNMRADLKKNGIHGHIVRPYIGVDFENKVIGSVRHSAYEQYRRY